MMDSIPRSHSRSGGESLDGSSWIRFLHGGEAVGAVVDDGVDGDDDGSGGNGGWM